MTMAIPFSMRTAKRYTDQQSPQPRFMCAQSPQHPSTPTCIFSPSAQQVENFVLDKMSTKGTSPQFILTNLETTQPSEVHIPSPHTRSIARANRFTIPSSATLLDSEKRMAVITFTSSLHHPSSILSIEATIRTPAPYYQPGPLCPNHRETSCHSTSDGTSRPKNYVRAGPSQCSRPAQQAIEPSCKGIHASCSGVQ
jgi:hypothetical protein